MNNNKSEITRSKFLLTALSTAVLTISLTGCLGGDSDNDDHPVTPPVTDQPGDGQGEQPSDPLTVSTDQGNVQGIELNGMRVFRGIPYGAEPGRFAAPTVAEQRSELRVLTEEFPTSCPQPAGSTFAIPSNEEDCLFLNVYAPEEPGDYPVMVWIHGGSLVTGSGGSAYEPKRLVDQGVVVVTINYRLGALGFLPHSSLADEDSSFGNYGLMDQQLALQWIQDNIDGFGGNPDNVTIFGESAGGHSVASHLASPGSAGLFDKAIIQSGSYSPAQLSQGAGQIAFGESFARATGCADQTDTGKCLRELPLETILSNQASSYLPVTGGTVLPESIDAKLGSGDFNGGPIMIGSNLQEGRLFVGIESFGNPVDEDDYLPRVEALLQSDQRTYDRAQVANAYLDRIVDLENIEPTDPSRYARALAAINTDWRFACGTIEQLQQVNAAGQAAYGYWFVDENAPNIVRTAQGPLTPPSFPWGASHAFEIQYVLADQATLEDRGATESQIALANAMAGYWTNFAKFGDPNATDGATGNVAWSPLSEAGNMIALEPSELGEVPATDFASYHNCDFWADPSAAQQP